VCNKEDCWSTNHTESERQQAREKFKEKYKSRFNNNFGRRFQKSFRQYVQEYEGTADDTDDIDEAFQSIVLEEDTDISDGNTEAESETFFTSAGQMSSAYAKEITNTLNNSAFVHSLSAYQQQTSDISPPKDLPTESQSFVASEQKHYGPP
jgi:hypothetical protein